MGLITGTQHILRSGRNVPVNTVGLNNDHCLTLTVLDVAHGGSVQLFLCFPLGLTVSVPNMLFLGTGCGSSKYLGMHFSWQVIFFSITSRNIRFSQWVLWHQIKVLGTIYHINTHHVNPLCQTNRKRTQISVSGTLKLERVGSVTFLNNSLPWPLAQILMNCSNALNFEHQECKKMTINQRATFFREEEYLWQSQAYIILAVGLFFHMSWRHSEFYSYNIRRGYNSIWSLYSFPPFIFLTPFF